MDSIFGRRNFRNEIIWFYKDTPGRPKRDFPRKHDTIFRYVMDVNNYTFNADDIRVPILDESKERYRTARVLGGRSYIGGESAQKGKIPEDVWSIPAVKGNSKQYTGYATQKPLALYQRIIMASSNKGDIVLDPFAGCATTCIAAEIEARQWVGIDFWENAEETILERMEREGMIVSKKTKVKRKLKQHYLFTDDFEFHLTSELPERTDDGKEAIHELPSQIRFEDPKDPLPGKSNKRRFLLSQEHGYPSCKGCDRVFDDPRYLELGHIHPRSQGGMDHINNYVLLCGPCNKVMSDKFTLKGLRLENKKHGFMAK